ncbi:MAG TPA: lysylphosphatidylglycerol synthase transmembrane domain-containing protein [Ktedonobacteraceae bacterium]|nr:lysylphosphatidylglycerol synthase transmembrane domain-containing protein [Ktedonobacteraceae bacterium]
MQHPVPAVPQVSPARLHSIRLVRVEEPGTPGTLVKEKGIRDRGEWPDGDIAIQTTASMSTLETLRPLPDYKTPLIPKTHIETPVTFDISKQTTARLMRLSGMIPVVRVNQFDHTHQADRQDRPYHTRSRGLAGAASGSGRDAEPGAYRAEPPLATGLGGGDLGLAGELVGPGDDDIPPPPDGEAGWWPRGIRQTGPLPVVNLYGDRPFGQMLPPGMADRVAAEAAPAKGPTWKAFLAKPAVKIILGLLVGIGLLFLVSKFVDIPATVVIMKQNLTTPRGITCALLSGVAFLMAFSIRGVRWKLFLNPIGKVSTFKAIQLFLVGIFLNFLLPIRGGEVAKSLMLKRVANIPISQSLPTVAMDKALDLMPAPFIMAIVPLLGIQMDIKLWVVLAIVGGLLVCLIFFVLLAAWKRDIAITLLQKLTGLLPGGVGNKIEGFATGFVDSLLMGASQPRIFIPAMLLTCVAVTFDGLFAMLAFWTIGYPIPFGTAIFGYTVYNMFYILPTPPGQVGSNEAVGLLVFAGLLHLPADKVTAMFVFSHPWAAVLMCVTGMACLSALGLTLSTAMKVQTGGADTDEPEGKAQMSMQVQSKGI